MRIVEPIFFGGGCHFFYPLPSPPEGRVGEKSTSEVPPPVSCLSTSAKPSTLLFFFTPHVFDFGGFSMRFVKLHFLKFFLLFFSLCTIVAYLAKTCTSRMFDTMHNNKNLHRICATMRKLAILQGKSQNKSIALDAFLVLKCSVSQLTEGFPAHFLSQPPQTISKCL